MKSVKDISNEQLNWIQPKTTQQLFELRTPSDLCATLNFPKAFGSLAEAESEDGKWTLKRVGFFHTKITIRNVGEENDYAVFKPNIMATSGILEFANGKKFLWQSSNFWATKFEFKEESGQTVVTIKSGIDDPKLKDWFKTHARVEIQSDKESSRDISLLILLGWYLIIVLQMDSATGAVVAAAT
jgi:hypothetical protein